MRKWLVSPLLSLTLFLMWLLLVQSISFSHVFLAAVLAVGIPFLSKSLMPHSPTIRKPKVILDLVLHVLVDISRSAIAVSYLIVFRHNKNLNTQFIYIPLTLTDPSALAVLAGIINCTPGTVWVEINPKNHALLLHVFDLKDEAWWRDAIRDRFEKPLLAIYENKELH